MGECGGKSVEVRVWRWECGGGSVEVSVEVGGYEGRGECGGVHKYA